MGVVPQSPEQRVSLYTSTMIIKPNTDPVSDRPKCQNIKLCNLWSLTRGGRLRKVQITMILILTPELNFRYSIFGFFLGNFGRLREWPQPEVQLGAPDCITILSYRYIRVFYWKYVTRKIDTKLHPGS